MNEAMHMTGVGPGARRARGFSMVEVLVSLIVMAVGLLGMGALQVMSKRANFEAAQRTAATALAYDLIERMRANPSQLLEYAGDAGTPAPLLGGETLSKPAKDCIAGTCTPFELSQFDRWEWETQLDGAAAVSGDQQNTAGLVLPTGCVGTDVPGGMTDRSGAYTVAIAWRGSAPLGNPTTSACGQGSGRYDGDDGTPDAHRRVLVVTTFITTQ